MIRPSASASATGGDTDLDEDDDEEEEAASPTDFFDYEDDCMMSSSTEVHTPTASGGSSNLSKMAEAANKKMRKLKTNFSLKTSDITRSLSSIKKNGGGSGGGAGGAGGRGSDSGYILSGIIDSF